MKILKDVLDERSELTVREGSRFSQYFEIFLGGKPSTTRLVAMLHRNDRFAILFSLYRTQVKIRRGLFDRHIGAHLRKLMEFTLSLAIVFYSFLISLLIP